MIQNTLQYNALSFVSFLKCWLALGKKCPYSEIFWSVFSRIRTKYEEIRSISPYLVRMQANTDQNNSEYGHFLASVEKSHHLRILTGKKHPKIKL